MAENNYLNKNKTNILSIKTPEGVIFSFQIAGPITRMFGWLIDAFVIFFIVAALVIIFMLLTLLFAILGAIRPGFILAVLILAFFVISIGYSIVLEWYWQGQTVGKKFLRLRVIDEQGLRLRFSQVVIRNLLRFIDSFPSFYLVGGLASLISRKNQRLGDFAANTIVIWSPKISEPDLDQLLKGKYNSFIDFPHLEARLRQNVSPQEASVALRAIIRRDELDSNARIELFHEIALHFKSIVEFPQEATDGISDEQYIRNVVDAIFRPGAGTGA